MDPHDIRKLFVSDRTMVVLEQLRMAHEELVKRIEMQMRLLELLGLLLAAIYSTVVIAKDYQILLLVPLLAGIVAIWWTDRQRFIIFLRRFIANDLEDTYLSSVLDESDRFLAKGWQSYYLGNYSRNAQIAHMIVFGSIFFASLLPTLIFCLGCICTSSIEFVHGTEFYIAATKLNELQYGKAFAFISVFLGTAGSIYACRILQSTKQHNDSRPFDSYSAVQKLRVEVTALNGEVSQMTAAVRQVESVLDLQVGRLDVVGAKLDAQVNVIQDSTRRPTEEP